VSLDFSITAIVETTVCERNITHNLANMADEAGLYEALWRPGENGFILAKDIIPILKSGLEKLKEEPEKFKKLGASNGWGTYEGLVSFVEDILENCEKYPNGKLYTWR
jgi:hypothetical protein